MPPPILTTAAINYYYDHPVDFVEDNFIAPARKAIKGLVITNHQKSLLNEISKSNRVAVESGHGSGKSTVMAWIAFWFAATRHTPAGQLTKIPITAPTAHQLRDIIWPEIRRWLPLSRIAPLFTVMNDEAFMTGYKSTTFIRSITPKSPDAAQGFHAAHLLWICDEAFGITDDLIYETIEGSLTEPDNRIIIAGQHSVMTGYCHDAFNRDRESWSCLRFNSEESPLAKPEYAHRIARKYGKESPVYRVRVLGMDPGDNPDSYLSIADVQAAINREVPISGEFAIGCDCARFGDDLTVVTARVGNHVFAPAVKSKTDTDDIVDLILQEVRRIRKEHGSRGPCHVKIDATGGYGAGTIDALNKNSEDNLIVVPVNFSESGGDECHDKISQMWHELKESLPYLHLPDDDFLFEELVTRSYSLDSKSRIQIEPKKDYKKDHEGSPDRSDSLALCITTKTATPRVFAPYQSTNAKFRRNFDLDFKHIEAEAAQVLGVMFRDGDTSLSGNWFFWGRRSKTLRVYAEWIHPTPVLDIAVADAMGKAQVPLVKKPAEVCVEKIFGNEEMFNDGSNLARLIKKNGVSVKHNVSYNEAAAIARTNQMFDAGQIIVSYDDCPETDRQYRNWRIENSQPVAGFPLCRCLLIVINELRIAGEIDEQQPLPAYSKKKYKIRENLKRGEFLPINKKERNPDDWLLT